MQVNVIFLRGFFLNFTSLTEFHLLYMRLDQEVHKEQLFSSNSTAVIPIPLPTYHSLFFQLQNRLFTSKGWGTVSINTFNIHIPVSVHSCANACLIKFLSLMNRILIHLNSRSCFILNTPCHFPTKHMSINCPSHVAYSLELLDLVLLSRSLIYYFAVATALETG